ncbi:MAG: hypothetical protein HQK78_14035 [Desulfobacterales bacterium]|nr:hypothetical protein [Desulfobacterales bacterium]
MIKNKKILMITIISIVVNIIFLILFINFVTKDKKGIQKETMTSETQKSNKAPQEFVENKKVDVHKESKTSSTVSKTKSENIDKNAKLDIEFVNESLRVYIKSLFFKYRHAKNRDDFMAKVREQLMKEFSAEKAEKILKVFEKYMACEIELQNQMPNWEQPKNPEGFIALLNKIHEFRKSKLGDDLADRLFSYQNKVMQFDIMRTTIDNDKSLYGNEKEKRLQALATQIFGDDDILQDKSNESAYQNRLKLYSKDFEEMNEEERQKKIKALREEFYSPEIVEKMEIAEEQIKKDKVRDTDYDSKKNEILKNTNLNDSQKEKEINQLREKMYGALADEIRRGEEFSKKYEEEIIAKGGKDWEKNFLLNRNKVLNKQGTEGEKTK